TVLVREGRTVVNLRLALRSPTRTPFVTGVAVRSLSLGMGANAAIFSLFDQMLLRPLPVQEPGRWGNLAAPGPKPGATSCNPAAAAAISSPSDPTLLRPRPAREPGSLVHLAAPGPKPGSTSCNQAGACEDVFSYPMFRALERAQGALQGLAAHVSFDANLATR